MQSISYCQGGVNRSPIFAIAYLARYIMTLEEAVLHVSTLRSAVRIQTHYLHQLEEWLNDIIICKNQTNKL